MVSGSPSSGGSTSPSEAVARATAFASIHRRLLGSDAKVSFGRFVLERPLGRGAHGRVYAAFDPTLERQVALKVIATDGPEAVQAGLREARALARLRHPHLVQIHDAVLDGDTIGLAMELVDGTTLRQWLAGKPSRAQILDVMLAVGDGLAALHRAGLVHRDIKPANVVVDAEHGARIIDLGLAHDFTETPTRRLRSGTPGYLAPEQLDGVQVGPAADQYAWAVMLWEALTGDKPRVPAEGGPLPHGLSRILRRALAEDPNARHPSVAIMAKQIRRWRRRGRTLGLGALLLAGGGALVATQLALSPGEDPCAEPNAELVELWSPSRAESLHDRLAALSAPTAEALAGRITEEIAADHVELLQMDRWVCEQRAAGAATQDEAFCLDEAAAELAATVRTLEAIDGVALPDAADVVARMVSPVHCRLHPAARPDDADAEDLRVLARTRGELQSLGHACPILGADECTRRFDALLEGVADASDCAIAPVAQYERGRGLMVAGRPDEAFEQLTAAAWSAESCGAVAVEFSAKRHAAGLAARRGELETAKWWLASAEAALHRIGDDELRGAELLLTRGTVTALAGEPRRSVEQLQRAVQMLQAHADIAGPSLAVAYVNLGQSARQAGDHEAAVQAIEHGLALTRRRVGPTHPDVGRTLTSLAIALHQAGRTEDALRACDEAIEVFAPWAERYPVDLSQALNNRGLMQRAGGDLEAAQASFRRALQRLPTTGTEGPAERFATLHNLGVTRALAGDLDGAAETLAEALAAAQVRWPQPTMETDGVALSLANVQLRTEAFEDAAKQACPVSMRADARVGLAHVAAIRAAAVCATAMQGEGRDAEVVARFEARLDEVGHARASVDRGGLRFAIAKSLVATGARARGIALARLAAADTAEDPESQREVEAWLATTEP